jgi:radical SAM enzyme (TIGR01210 family)
MCDLWKFTTNERVPLGAIPQQIATALGQLPEARYLKLYNAGNFFDAQAIPPEDLPHVAELVQHHERVIVECHPRLVNDRCLQFQSRLMPQLEVAMGLETVHPEALPRLNKRMTLDDYTRASRFLKAHSIGVRAFILLRPPFLSESEGVLWAKRSLDFAFANGVDSAVIIPTRGGNGAMEQLAAQGYFQPPRLDSLEEVVAYGIEQRRGLVFADLWDARPLATCPRCGPARLARLEQMNLEQERMAPVTCTCERNNGT